MKRETKSGDEQDVVDARRYLVWRRGEIARIKRGMRRRERRVARRDIQREKE